MTTETEPVRGPGRPRLVETKLIEIKLIKAYVPLTTQPDPDGVYEKLPPESVVSLPSDEAADICEKGIAAPTRNSFR